MGVMLILVTMAAGLAAGTQQCWPMDPAATTEWCLANCRDKENPFCPPAYCSEGCEPPTDQESYSASTDTSTDSDSTPFASSDGSSCIYRCMKNCYDYTYAQCSKYSCAEECAPGVSESSSNEANYESPEVPVHTTPATLTPVYDTPTALTWKSFPSGPNGFYRAPVLLSGVNESILIDGGFGLSDGKAIAEAIQSSATNLTTVYITKSDPDYYFNLAPIKAAFPDARFIASSGVIATINATVEEKIANWKPTLQDNGPQTVADVVPLEAYDEECLSLEGQNIEIVSTGGAVRYVWVESLNGIFGGQLVYSGLYLWTAELRTAADFQTWIAMLDEMASRNPTVVVPGHMDYNSTMGIAAIQYTRDYLVAFEEESAIAVNSTTLIAAMTNRFPDKGLRIALDVGAKTATGEMISP